MGSTSIQPYIDQLLAGDPLLVGIVGGIVLLLLIGLIGSLNRRAALGRAPRLELVAFQLAPLGRDASLKIHNTGEPLVLTDLRIYGRSDVTIKNTVTGHQLPTDGNYRILLESNGTERLLANFEVEFTYATAARKAYRQRFRLSPVEEVKFSRA